MRGDTEHFSGNPSDRHPGVGYYPFCIRARRPHIDGRHNPIDFEECILLGGAVFGLSLIPLLYLPTGFPSFADYRFRSAMG